METHKKSLVFSYSYFTKTDSAFPIFTLMFSLWEHLQLIFIQSFLLLLLFQLILQSRHFTIYFRLENKIVAISVICKLKVPVAIHRISKDVIHILSESFHKICIKKPTQSHAEWVKRIILLRILSIKVIISSPYLRLLSRIRKLKDIILWWSVNWLRLSSSHIIVNVSWLRLPICIAIISIIGSEVWVSITHTITIVQTMISLVINLYLVLVAIESIVQSTLGGTYQILIAIDIEFDCRILQQKSVVIAIDSDHQL